MTTVKEFTFYWEVPPTRLGQGPGDGRQWDSKGHVIHEQWVPRLRALTLKPANTGAVKQNKSVGLI